MRMLSRHLALIGLAAFVLVSFLLFKDRYLLSALVLAGIYTISILGLVLLVGLSGQYSLGHAAFFGVAAYISAVLTRSGIEPWLALIVAVAVSTVIAIAIAIPLARLHGYYLAVATLAFGLVVYSVMNGWRRVTLGPSGITNIRPLEFAGIVVKGEVANYWLAWGIALFVLWGATNLWRSRAGQAMLAVKRDEAGAAALGINVAFVRTQIFGLSAALAATGGSLYAHYVSFISPDRFGMMTSFDLLLAALLGGVGSPFGAVLGALLLIALPEILAPLRDFKVIFYGLIFILVSLYLPYGIAGLIDRLMRRLPFGGLRSKEDPLPERDGSGSCD